MHRVSTRLFRQLPDQKNHGPQQGQKYQQNSHERKTSTDISIQFDTSPGGQTNGGQHLKG